MKKFTYIISFIILFTIGFLFLHSELDFFTPENHHHLSHDFCDIVDEAKIENPDIDILKIKSLDIPVTCFLTQINLFCDSPITNLYYSNKSYNNIDLGVLYSSFLI